VACDRVRDPTIEGFGRATPLSILHRNKGVIAMNLEQLMGRYFRLQQELSIAYRQQPWQHTRIDRLADDLSSTERDIAALQAGRARSNPQPQRTAA